MFLVLSNELIRARLEITFTTSGCQARLILLKLAIIIADEFADHSRAEPTHIWNGLIYVIVPCAMRG